MDRETFREVLAGRCETILDIYDRLHDEEEKKLTILKYLSYAQDCITHQPGFVTGYTRYGHAFSMYSKFVKPELVFTDSKEREFVKQVQKIGLGVVDKLKEGLANKEMSKSEKEQIHAVIEKVLGFIFWKNETDFVKGEEQEEMTIEKAQELMFARQRLQFSGGFEILNNRADQLVEKVRSSTKTHLRPMMYTLRIQILGFRPFIWRRVQVPGSITLHSLQDRVIAPIFGWCRNYHAYYFRKIPFEKNNQTVLGLPQPDLVFGPIYSHAVDKMHEFTHNIYSADDSKVELFQLLENEGEEMLFVYDLGDGYRHKITVEKIEESNEQATLVEDGDYCCPPEDCGSISTYVDCIHAFYYGSNMKNNPNFSKDKKSSYSDSIERLNRAANYRDRTGDFNPFSFSLVDAKRRVQNALRSDISNLDNSNFFNFNFQTNKGTVGKFEETKLLNRQPIKSCAICNSSENLKQCSKCRSVYYCCREHQLKDWSSHKTVCGKEK